MTLMFVKVTNLITKHWANYSVFMDVLDGLIY